MSREERVYNVGRKLKFTLTEDHLIEDGSRGVSHWRQAWPLQQLSPEVESQTGRPQGTMERLIGGVTIFALGIIVYFSDFNTNVPLLAPLLSVVGLIVMGRGLKTLRVERGRRFVNGMELQRPLSRIAIAAPRSVGHSKRRSPRQ